jgi:hypothetical protein
MESYKVSEHQWEDIGIEHSQYFPGRGTAFTEWDDVFVGIGDTPEEAAEDALEYAAQCGYELDGIEAPAWSKRSGISVSEWLRENNPVTYRVRFSAYCGMTTYDETFTDEAEALDALNEQIERLNKGRPESLTFPTLTELPDGNHDYEYESPDDAVMVSDDDGILSYETDSEAQDDALENSEHYYHVALYLKREEAEEAADTVKAD